MAKDGFGGCQKRDENFNGQFSCFITESAICTDTKNSTTTPGKQLSSEACKSKNEGNITLFYRTFAILHKEMYLNGITLLNKDVNLNRPNYYFSISN